MSAPDAAVPPEPDSGSGQAPMHRTRLGRLAPLTRRVIDPVMRPAAGRLPGFAILVHRGRRTGRIYRTPVAIFRRGGDVVIALGSGSDVRWVGDVLAGGGCELVTRGRTSLMTEPRIWADPSMRTLPRPLRWVGRAIGLREFLSLREVRDS